MGAGDRTTARAAVAAERSLTTSGTIVFVAAALVAIGLLVLAAVDSNACSADHKAVALAALRRKIVLIGVGLAAVPVIWAVLARRRRYSWAAWATLAVTVLVLAGGCAATTRDVMSVCC